MNEPSINTSFSLTQPGLQLAWDSVSRGTAKTCWRLYYYKIVMGYQLRRVDGFPPDSEVHLAFGIWMHSAREIYYAARANGATHEDGIDQALDYVLTQTWNRQLQRPWASSEPTKTRKTLVRSVVWYLNQWENDPLQTIILANGKPAVELSFKIDTGMQVRGEPILAAGHIDRAVTFQDHPYLSDLKTTKSELGSFFFDTFKPDDQLCGYQWAGQVGFAIPVKGIILDALQVGVTFTRFQRAPITYSPAEVDEWFQGFKALVTQAAHYAREQFWPMNEKACFRCEMRKVCAVSPGARQGILDSMYVRRVWDPLVARGDI